jgi:hypothetical protein
MLTAPTALTEAAFIKRQREAAVVVLDEDGRRSCSGSGLQWPMRCVFVDC